jgi:hypothetical protein
MAFRGEKGCALSSFLDHTTEVVDRVGSTMPDFTSVDAFVSWVDSVSESALQDINAWQPKRAEVIQMPKRRRRSRWQS